jgi:hypothetical protein
MSAVETRNPMEVEQLLETAAIDLDGLGKALDEATDEMNEAEKDWTEHYDEVLEILEDEVDKLPGEEKCISIARRRGGWDQWNRLRRAERNLKPRSSSSCGPQSCGMSLPMTIR